MIPAWLRRAEPVVVLDEPPVDGPPSGEPLWVELVGAIEPDRPRRRQRVLEDLGLEVDLVFRLDPLPTFESQAPELVRGPLPGAAEADGIEVLETQGQVCGRRSGVKRCWR